MTTANYDEMTLQELRQYVLKHREDIEAFHQYIDRSKIEGQMTTLDLSNSQWEEKIKAAIKNSSHAIRWYCDSQENNDQVISITNWWKKLNQKNIIKHHITGIEVDKEGGIWEPTQIKPPETLTIKNPDIELHKLTAFLKYQDQDKTEYSIEAVAIDLDLNNQNLFVWSPNSAEVFIFSLENQQST
ncbi:MAG: DUF6887 family protein [Cyanobacteriota bacterium]